MSSTVENGWDKIVKANIMLWNKQRDFFVDGWRLVVNTSNGCQKCFLTDQKTKKTHPSKTKKIKGNY